MELLEQYFDLQKQIYDYFGYAEDWVVIPLQGNTDSYWFVDQEYNGQGKVVWSPEPLTKESVEAGDKIYSGSIYTQRFLPRWVYRAEKYTMVCVDTHTDGNKFLLIFDNTKECKDKTLKELHEEVWG